MQKDWPETNEDLFSFSNVSTFASANLVAAVVFNLFPLKDYAQGLSEAYTQDTWKRKGARALVHLAKYGYEVGASFFSFIPFSLAVALPQTAMPEAENSYDELAELAVKILGSAATASILGHLKPYLERQNLILLFTALLITSYSGDLNDLYAKFTDSDLLQKSFECFLTPIISVSSAIPLTLIGYGYSATVNYGNVKFADFFKNNKENMVTEFTSCNYIQ